MGTMPRCAIALLLTMTLVPLHADPQSPVPPTATGWKTLRQQRDRAIARQLDELRDRLGVTVTPRLIAGVACYEIAPRTLAAANRNRVVINTHGGSHVFKAGEAGTLEGIHLASRVGIRVISIDYRLPPDHPFPAGMDDVMRVWKELIRESTPARVAIYGVSSGGGLALSMVQRAKAESLPLPAAVVAATPWSDLSKTGDSYFSNADIDTIVVRYEGPLESAAKLYAHGVDLRDPRVSPVYGDFGGFPPTLLASGTRDLFLSNTVRVARKLRQAGVETQLDLLEAQSHGEFLVADTPETGELYASIARFLDEHLDR